MPGSSLWLLPPEEHPLNSCLGSLIEKTSVHFGSPHRFIPHVTLTSEISPSSYSPDPQKWLESIIFPKSDDVRVRFGRLSSEDVFVRKLYIDVSKSDGLRDVATIARKSVHGFENEEKAKTWALEKYTPHLSLLYHDCPKVSDAEIAKVESFIRESGLDLEGEGELGGWIGGRVVLVATDGPIKEWAPIGKVSL